MLRTLGKTTLRFGDREYNHVEFDMTSDFGDNRPWPEHGPDAGEYNYVTA